MIDLQTLYFFVEARPTGTGPPNVGIGSIVLIVATAVFVMWIAWLWIAARPQSGGEEPAKNLQPYLSDGDLENVQLNTVLRSAMVAAAVLALVVPIYYLDEACPAADTIRSVTIDAGELVEPSLSLIDVFFVDCFRSADLAVGFVEVVDGYDQS